MIHINPIFSSWLSDYGVGYAWNHDPHTVSVGDYVTWTWETPTYVSDIVYGVHQTEKADDLYSMPGGFTSGTNSRVGKKLQSLKNTNL